MADKRQRGAEASPEPARRTYAISDRGRELLCEARDRKGASYRSIASDTGINLDALTKIFSGVQASHELLPELCQFLGIPLYMVINGIDRVDAVVLTLFRMLPAGDQQAVLRSLRLQVKGLGVDDPTNGIEPGASSNHPKARRP